MRRDMPRIACERKGAGHVHALGSQQEWLVRRHAAPDSSSVLILEDEPLIALLIEDVLEGAGFGVETTYRGEDALDNLARPKAAYKALVTDIDTPTEID